MGIPMHADFKWLKTGKMMVNMSQCKFDYELAKLILDIVNVQNTAKGYDKDPIGIRFEFNASKVQQAKNNAIEEEEEYAKVEQPREPKPQEPEMF